MPVWDIEPDGTPEDRTEGQCTALLSSIYALHCVPKSQCRAAVATDVCHVATDVIALPCTSLQKIHVVYVPGSRQEERYGLGRPKLGALQIPWPELCPMELGTWTSPHGMSQRLYGITVCHYFLGAVTR